MLTVMLCVGIIMAVDRAGRKRANPGNWG
jgi:rod shape determining protein RodA